MQTRNAWLALSLMLAVLIGACTSQPKPPVVDTAGTTAAIDSLTKAFVAAVAARDTNAVVNFYAPDGQLLAPGAPRAVGPDAIRALWAGFLRTPGLEFNLGDSHPLITEAGDMVVDVGSYNLRFMDPKGKPVEDVGKYVTVLKKVGGEWKIAIDTFNSDKPAPGM